MTQWGGKPFSSLHICEARKIMSCLSNFNCCVSALCHMLLYAKLYAKCSHFTHFNRSLIKRESWSHTETSQNIITYLFKKTKENQYSKKIVYHPLQNLWFNHLITTPQDWHAAFPHQLSSISNIWLFNYHHRWSQERRQAERSEIFELASLNKNAISTNQQLIVLAAP
jgi:hypothetical protein